MDLDPKEIAKQYADDAREGVQDTVEEVTEAGKKTWGFLRSLWFWLVAAPLNMAIGAFVVAWAFPFLFVGFPPVPEELKDKPKAVVIDKDRQAAYAFENGKIRHRFVILTGRAENDTPVGKFSVSRKIQDYRSKEYDAPMPYSLFFIDHRGIAMHASLFVGPKWVAKELTGKNPNIGSHGCVRFTLLGSRRIFNWADIGTPVWVTHLRGGGPEGEDAEKKEG